MNSLPHTIKVLCNALFIGACIFASLMNSIAQAAPATTLRPTASPTNARGLQTIVDEVAALVLERFKAKKLGADQLAISLIDLSAGNDNAARATASFRGEVRIYPASVVKLFYLAAVERWLEDKKLTDSPELQRTLRDMIVDSSNDATSMVVDALTSVGSGPELAGEEFVAWKEKRNVVNRFFAGLGYADQNINQKPWNEGPYGRERQFLGTNYDNRNMMTTAATARLLGEIMLGRWVSPQRSQSMQKLLQRDPQSKPQPESQIDGFIGTALKEIPGAKQWSKAGWTSTTRHDAACVELPVSLAHPRGARFILVVFTTGHAADTEILPTVAREVIARLTVAP